MRSMGKGGGGGIRKVINHLDQPLLQSFQQQTMQKHSAITTVDHEAHDHNTQDLHTTPNRDI